MVLWIPGRTPRGHDPGEPADPELQPRSTHSYAAGTLVNRKSEEREAREDGERGWARIRHLSIVDQRLAAGQSRDAGARGTPRTAESDTSCHAPWPPAIAGT
jgi:hypothetical protein